MVFCLGNVTYLLAVTRSIIIIISTYSILLFKFKFGLLSNIQQMISLLLRLLPCRGGAWVEATNDHVTSFKCGGGGSGFRGGDSPGFLPVETL